MKIKIYILSLFLLVSTVIKASDELPSPTLMNIGKCFPQVVKNLSKKLSKSAIKTQTLELESIQEELQRIFVLKNRVEVSRYIEFRGQDGLKYSARMTPLNSNYSTGVGSTLPVSKKNAHKLADKNKWPVAVELFKYKSDSDIVSLPLTLEQRSLKYDQFLESLIGSVSIIRDEVSENFIADPGWLYKRSTLNGKLVDFEIRDGSLASKKSKVLNCKATASGYPLCICKI